MKHLPIITPGTILLNSFILITTAMLLGSWLYGLFSLDGEPTPQMSASECDAIARSVERRLRRGEAEFQGLFYPEGKIFSYSFFGNALISRAVQDEQRRAETVNKLEWVIDRVDRLSYETPFDICQKMTPRGGIIAGSQRNLLRAGYAVLGGKRQDLIDSFHTDSKILYDAFMVSPSGNLASYPGFPTWPVDNCGALESLRLHDQLYGTKYSGAIDRWTNWMQAHLDRTSGMMPAEIGEHDLPIYTPRGCALAWSLALMPSFAPEFAKSQYETYHANWLVPVLGAVGVREWHQGYEGHSDMPETGPVVGGIGAAASGLGIAAARANGDFATWRGELRGLEAIGFPIWLPNLEKSYFCQQFLMADTIALWGKTICRWSEPTTASATAVTAQFSAVSISNPGYAYVLETACLITAAICAFLSWLVVVTVRDALGQWREWSLTQLGFLLLESAVIAIWILYPPFLWVQAIASIALLDFFDQMTLRPKRIRRFFEESARTRT